MLAGNGTHTPQPVRCAAFSAAPDLILFITPRCIVAFDTEIGRPLSFTGLKDVMASAVSLFTFPAPHDEHGYAATLDSIFVLHEDDSLSCWRRSPGTLSYSCWDEQPLLPPPFRVGRPFIVAAAACQNLQHFYAARCLMRCCVDASSCSTPCSFGLMATTSRGLLCKWSVDMGALVAITSPPSLGNATFTGIELQTVLHGLPAAATSLCMRSRPTWQHDASGSRTVCTVNGAAATENGYLVFFHVQRGGFQPLGLCIDSVIEGGCQCHVAWVGDTPYVLSFSSTKVAGGFCNALHLTHSVNRQTSSFRAIASESAPLAGVRISPSGRHILLLFKGTPAELWEFKVRIFGDKRLLALVS